jgi:eukaryotic-like serine/threonine-protein kinase
MTPERWREVGRIFHAALQLESADRSAFLSSACGNDEVLRKEVESLIAAHEKEGSFIDSPAFGEVAEAVLRAEELKAGQLISNYEIISLLGRGGMGEVYLAQDNRLGRKVALKFLPAGFTRDHERLRRFEREARTASALNHPNILTIHEIGEAEGRRFITNEFVDGQTLRSRLVSGSLGIHEALDIAEQVASALAAAQTEGIIHRDIKPENIMVRADGIVKVLDFGLAKLAEDRTQGPNDPTQPLVKTGSGVVMGTAQYMSPEQARGREVDGRTDIFSLGAVLYEMITGTAPFTGDTASDVIASILKTEPPILRHPSQEVPAELERIVTKALEKDREERYQRVKDLLLDLRRLKQRVSFEVEQERAHRRESGASVPIVDRENTSSSTGEIRTAVSTITHSLSTEIQRHKAGVFLAAIVIVLSLGLGGFFIYRRVARVSRNVTEAPQVVGNAQVTFVPGLDNEPGLSPDGNSVAYSSDKSGSVEIYLKQLTPGGREIQLTSDGHQNYQPAWSPDGQSIAYFSRERHGIWIIPAFGGTPKQLTDFGSWPSWSRDSTFVAFQSGEQNQLAPSTIWIIAAAGGTPKQITQVGNPAGGHGAPSWSPDGKRLVFTTNDYLGTSLWSVSVSGTDSKKVEKLELAASVENGAVYSADGRSIYFGGFVRGNYGILALSISEDGNSNGEPRMIMSFPGKTIQHLSLSASGKKLAYASLDVLSTLTSLPLSPTSNEPAGPPVPLSNDRSQRHVAPSFSSDGRRVAFGQWRAGVGADVWLIDANGKNQTQITTNVAVDNIPSWFPDQDRLAFVSNRTGHFTPWSISLTTGKENLLANLEPDVSFARLSPDGKRIAYNSSRGGPINVWVTALDGSAPRQLTFDNEMMAFPCWSPDGKYLALEVKRGADNYLAVMPSDGGTPEMLVTDPGLSWPHDWSHDGDKIVFAGWRNGIWNVYWVSRSTKVQKQLTDYSKPNAFVRYPAWSPLGNQIVYEYAETTGNVWVMELK